MKSVEALAQELLTNFERWRIPNQPLVVAMDAYPGSGKTTLANHLGEHHEVTVFNQDKYLYSLEKRRALLNASANQADTAILEFRDDRKLLRELEQLKESGADSQVYLVEGCFVLDPRRYQNAWDKTIYLASDFTQTDARRIEREKARWGDDYMPESHPDSLMAVIAKTYRQWIQQTRPDQRADLVVKVDNQP